AEGSEQGPRRGVAYWDQAIARLNELGNSRIEFSNRHSEDVSELRKQALGNQIITADMVAKRVGLSYVEPNANEASAEETMKASGLPELASANASAVISTANASLAASMADLKAALVPAMQAQANALAAIQAGLAPIYEALGV